MTLFDRWKAAPRSWWHETAGDYPLTKAEGLPARVPFVIVGAGITGAACAHELTQRGVAAKDILVLEAGPAAFGASGRNGGFVLTFPGPELLDWHRHGDAAFRHLVAENIRNRELVIETAEHLGVPMQRGGSWYGAASPEEAEEIHRCHRLLVDAGHSDYELHPGIPGTAREDYTAAIFQPADAGVHPAAYAHALVAASGAALLTECEVTAPPAAEEGAVRLATTQGEVVAGHVVFAINAAAHWLLPETFRDLIRPVRNQVWLIEMEGETDNRLWSDAVYYADYGYDYWRQFPDGRILVGGARKPAAASEENTAELEPNPDVQAHFERVLMPRLTRARPTVILRHWQGIMGFSPDGLPMIAEIPGAVGRAWFAGGFTGYGLAFHRVVVQSLLSRMLDGADSCIWDAERLSPNPAAR